MRSTGRRIAPMVAPNWAWTAWVTALRGLGASGYLG